MLERARAKAVANALDVGCGEGRFCRLLQLDGIRTIGIDPTEAFIEQARRLDPRGEYAIGDAEALAFPDASFDLVVSYLALIDIPDIAKAIAEMARVLRPGGSLLVANLTSFTTAAVGGGWTTDADGGRRFCIDNYLEERPDWAAWRGIRIRNWHRPLGRYMELLLGAGLILRYFSEPAPIGGAPAAQANYRRVPYFLIMEWEKPSRDDKRVPDEFARSPTHRRPLGDVASRHRSGCDRPGRRLGVLYVHLSGTN